MKKNKGFTLKIELSKPRSEVKVQMDKTTTHKVFKSAKDYRRRPKHRKAYGGDE